MKLIKFRYIVEFTERMKSGAPVEVRTLTKVFTIEEIEQEHLSNWIMYNVGIGYGTYKLIARNQYTGLKDANGKEVFEGDILKSHMGDLVVTFDNGRFIAEMKDKQPGKWDYHIEARDFSQVAIIGNIYENGELLNEQKTANIGAGENG